ncbi:MAG: GFA family protein [Betaproteobacteria bacterium]
MSSEAVSGSCLCGSIKFEVTPPFAAFRYCHCTRCQKASGAAHATNAFLKEKQFKWLAGESLIKRFNLPGAKRFAVAFCTECGTRVPHKTGENMLIPAGLLDADPGARPENSIFWKSKAAWYVSPQDMPKFDEAS